MTTKQRIKEAPFTHGAAGAAIALSLGLGGVGVASMFGDRLGAGDPLAIVCAGVFIGGLAVGEIAAAVNLLHAERRESEGAGARKWAARLIFAAATVSTLMAGHYGAQALSDRFIGPQRAPFEERMSAAAAAKDSAARAIDRFEARRAETLAVYDRDLEAARDGAAMAITARRGTLEARGDREAALDSELRLLEADLASAEAEHAAALAAIARAPKPLSEAQTWGLAALFELLKGVMIWAATPKAGAGRKRRAFSLGQIVADLRAALWAPKGDSLIAYLAHEEADERRRRVRALCEEDIARLGAVVASLNTSLQHERRARMKAA